MVGGAIDINAGTIPSFIGHKHFSFFGAKQTDASTALIAIGFDLVQPAADATITPRRPGEVVKSAGVKTTYRPNDACDWPISWANRS
jgi:hypothetical protein